MRQRVMIAMAIANDPRVLIADEPTTALDVTIQAQVLEVLHAAQEETGAAVVMITHDLGVVAGMADDVMVMYAGRPVETAPVDEIYYRPRMPYTMGLLGAVPRVDAAEKTSLVPIDGHPPEPRPPPTGCSFAAAVPARQRPCLPTANRSSPGAGAAAGHRVACRRADGIEPRRSTAPRSSPAPAVPVSPLCASPRDQRRPC